MDALSQLSYTPTCTLRKTLATALLTVTSSDLVRVQSWLACTIGPNPVHHIMEFRLFPVPVLQIRPLVFLSHMILNDLG
jgi:hypothetical protein